MLRAMSHHPRVIIAASNAFDHIYLRRNVGLSAVPWPGLSVQLSRIRYTGGGERGRREVLFCCGAQPYNKPIEQWAQIIVNASRKFPVNSAAASSNADVPDERRFAWLNDLYPKSYQCKRVRVAASPPPAPAMPPAAARSDARPAGGGLLAGGEWAASATAGRRLRSRSKSKKIKGPTVEQCGYKYEDVASHPMVLLLPYSVHSYGLVNAYSMGLPVVAPSLKLLSKLHTASGIVSHKGPGNVPWRSSKARPIRTWLMRDPTAWYNPGPYDRDAPCCAHDPNDACDPEASAAWLQFADWYRWPHIQYYDEPSDLMSTIDALLANATRRNELSAAQKDFFRRERARAKGHVGVALQRALDGRDQPVS